MKSVAGTCRYSGNKAKLFARDHPECRRTFDVGWNRMVELAARSHAFDEKALRLSLAEIARNSYGDRNTVNQALEVGWKPSVAHACNLPPEKVRRRTEAQSDQKLLGIL